ncbi:Gfo/Idh/MocA family protein [Saccharibacillus sp. JS10]|uniref:Gfo/Idh/MocA family protein n=1 Tax=Saccharibacillus sp. JS10 TaxID=2950552 RepID=UPI00210ED258|nr:Gfo/Idh/MocA family oxidoreductase [Saccharibacillus sp. JS10]MCQ4088512.1 Gfo/Idh/MocA family oxidoreductase [Saccharibacillus sp. JS10]
MKTKTELGAAIIGCGAIFVQHANALIHMEDVALKLVIDIDLEKARQQAEKYTCEAGNDYRSILQRADIQVVHICTPHHLHAPMIEEFLAAGKHVLTEKPIAHTPEANASVQKAAAQSEAQLGVVFQNRYNESSRLIRETIDSGRLGSLLGLKGIVTWSRSPEYYTESDWRGKWETEGGGLLINQAIHTIDLLQWFAGGNPTKIKGSVTTDRLSDYIEVEDTAHANIEFSNGVRVLFYGTNSYMQNSPVELELVFEHGTLIQRQDRLFERSGGEETERGRQAPNAIGEKSYWGMSHRLLIEDFYNHLREDRPFWLHAEEGSRALQIVHGIYAASSKQSKGI